VSMIVTKFGNRKKYTKVPNAGLLFMKISFNLWEALKMQNKIIIL